MRYVHPIIFKVGEYLPEQVDTYGSLLNDIIHIVDPSLKLDTNSRYTTPVTSNTEVNAGKIVKEELEKRLIDSSLVEQSVNPREKFYDGVDTYFKDENICVLLYFPYLDRNSNLIGNIEFELYSYISHLITCSVKKLKDPKNKIFLLVPRLPLVNEIFMEGNEVLMEACKNEMLIIIDRYGRTFNSSYSFKNEFTKHTPSILIEPKKLIEKKLIRRVGHFKRPLDRTGDKMKFDCHQYFYDAKHCVHEITYLIKKEITTEKYRHILFHGPESLEWLGRVMNGLDINTSIIDLTQKSYEEKLKGVRANEKCLLVVDLIHTGNTLKQSLLKKIRLVNPDIDLYIYTILNANEKKDTNNIIQLDDEISYKQLQRVAQQRIPFGSKCDMCYYQIEPSSTKGDQYLQFTSHVFWKLSDDAGYEEEKYHPLDRPPIRCLPNFTKLIADNGAYIVEKIERLFSEQKMMPSNYIFISPDEPAALELATVLKLILKIESIHIPREVIGKLKDVTNETKESLINEYKTQEWMERLLSYEENAQKKSAVVFDEFTTSYHTLTSLERLSRLFNLRVDLFFPMVILGKNKRQYEGRIFSLYNFPLILSNPRKLFSDAL